MAVSSQRCGWLKSTSRCSLHSLRWSEFQKKMGVVSWCCLRQDTEALIKEPLAYRKNDTPRTMFMIALLMDEYDYDDSCKFREMYRTQLGPDFNGIIGEYSESLSEHSKIWREYSMYPGLFTRSKTQEKQDIEHDYISPSSSHTAQLLMKCYFVIGRWIVNPKMSRAEYEKIGNF